MTTGTDTALRYFTSEAAALRSTAAENLAWAIEAEAAGRMQDAADYFEWALTAETQAAAHEATLAKMANDGAIWF